MARRVVITGIGVASPFGLGHEKLWQAVCKFQDGASDDAELTELGSRVTRVGRVPLSGVELAEFSHGDVRRRLARLEPAGRLIAISIAAGRCAVQDAGLDSLGARAGVVLGIASNDQGMIHMPRRSALYPILGTTLSPSAAVASELGALGPCASVAAACASSVSALYLAARHIQHGEVDVVLSGGACTPLYFPRPVEDFAALPVLSDSGRMGATCRPFDRHRDGFVLGEGASVLVLEELRHALRRGAPILAEVLSFGFATVPVPSMMAVSQSGYETAMRMALSTLPGDWRERLLDCRVVLNAHGTGTRNNDEAEAAAIAQVGDELTLNYSTTAYKGATTHQQAATGATETALCALGTLRGRLPGSTNLRALGRDAMAANLVAHGQFVDVDFVLKNSSGFCGTYNSVALARACDVGEA